MIRLLKFLIYYFKAPIGLLLRHSRMTAGVLILVGCTSFKGLGEFESGVGRFKSPDEYDSAVTQPGRLNPGPFILDWPVDNARLTRGFDPSGKRPHMGLDLAGPWGTPIMAAHDGFVVYAGRAYKGYGRMIIVEFNKDWATLYAHLAKIHVKEGDIVMRGQTIGTMGRTGRATGVHLHFELMRRKVPIDPLSELPQSLIRHSHVSDDSRAEL